MFEPCSEHCCDLLGLFLGRISWYLCLHRGNLGCLWLPYEVLPGKWNKMGALRFKSDTSSRNHENLDFRRRWRPRVPTQRYYADCTDFLPVARPAAVLSLSWDLPLCLQYSVLLILLHWLDSPECRCLRAPVLLTYFICSWDSGELTDFSLGCETTI